MKNMLNVEEKEVLKEIIEYFSDDLFYDIGFDNFGNPMSYDDDKVRLEQFKTVKSIIEKLEL